MSKAKTKQEQGVMNVRSDIVRKYVAEIDACVKDTPSDLPELACRFGVKNLDESFWIARGQREILAKLDAVMAHMGIVEEADASATTFASRKAG
jgi:hypothetical protein